MSSKKGAHIDSSFITVKEAAARSSYTPAYLTRLAKNGDLTAKKDGRIWLIDAASLEEYLNVIERRKIDNRTRLRIERKGSLNKAEYSAAWLFYKANIGAFDTKAALESLAIAGLSALVGLVSQSFMEAGASTNDLYDGTTVVIANLQKQTELIGVSLAELTTQSGADTLLASVLSLFY